MTVIQNTSNQELTVWTQNHGKESIKWEVGKAVLIEKFKTYHSVTPLDYGKRILLTMTYVKIPYYPTILIPKQYILNKMKNWGYMGIHCVTPLDYMIVFLILCVFAIALLCFGKMI